MYNKDPDSSLWHANLTIK